MEALSSSFFGVGSENGGMPDRANSFQRPNNFGHHAGELMPFGFKPDFMHHWNFPQAYNPYATSCSRVPGGAPMFEPPLPTYGEESTNSHEVVLKEESSNSPTDSQSNSHSTLSSQQHISHQQYESQDDANLKKKRDRFKGMSEDEVLMRMLPDHLVPNLDIVIIGINHGLTAAYVGHHYAGPGNHFWKCLYMSGLIPEPMNCYDDYRLLHYGIGFTNIVARCTKGSADLTRKELKEGIEILTAKIQRFKPKIAVFNGKGIYEIFCGNKNFYVGKQPDPFPGTSNTTVYVMPSSSARCSQLPRAVDKVPFYVALRKLRDYRRGDLPHLDESEVTFPDLELKVEPRKDRLDRQLKQQQEAAAAAAAAATSHSTLEKKRRLDSDVDFETMFPGVCSSYPSFPASRAHNGLMPTAGSSTSWNPSAWPPSMPGIPPLSFQHPSAAAGSSLVQRLTQVPTMDSVFGAMPLLLKPEDSSTGVSQYGQLYPCSSRAGNYWPGTSNHYGSGALTNYPYGFQSLYGSSAGSVHGPAVDGQYPGSRTLPCSSSFLYPNCPAVTSSSVHSLSSTYPTNLHAAAAAAAYDSSPFFLPSHGMSSGHIAGSVWPSSYQYASSRANANSSYSDPFNRDIPDGLTPGVGFDFRP